MIAGISLIAIAKGIGASVVSGVGVGMATWVKKRIGNKKKHPFDAQKAGRTALTAVVVGIAAWYNGYEITADNYEMYAAANAGVVVMLENGYQFHKKLIMKLLAKWGK